MVVVLSDIRLSVICTVVWSLSVCTAESALCTAVVTGMGICPITEQIDLIYIVVQTACFYGCTRWAVSVGTILVKENAENHILTLIPLDSIK